MDKLIKKYKGQMDKMMSDLIKKDKLVDKKLEKLESEKRRSVRKQKRR